MRMSVPSACTHARTTVIGGALACAAALTLSACTPTVEQDPQQKPPADSTTASGQEVAAHDSGLPAEARPEVARDGVTDCPYLETQFVAETNGQKVTASGTDERFDTPACVFWSYPDEPQLQVIVRHTGSAEEARAVVDHFAPVDLTDLAEDPAGWSGGRAGGGVIPGAVGGVYAVAKDAVAIVVLTNQKESVKAQLIAEQAIANLSL
ncbi:DUF2020 domain-containing protein [Corynebacterium sp. p3-SID1194]|uniref:DUF2020 domain-containing protein n=1 Tax=Corynebacterium sp. p3-SID1194 TaxID=2916105 RepID=UPI0021A800DD|nr:DUF2020 domain-containing protein [Corynebacterium sp. p3-SID1194]MCT1450501.1 DUF2020 domain-containing protein [Corynebacterium sp. p3-SID1194]